MKTNFSSTVVRYVHDIVTEEYVNVGVVLHDRERRFLKARCTQKYKRVSCMFEHIDGNDFRSLMRFVEDTVARLGLQYEKELELSNVGPDVLELLRSVLTFDDSALQFAPSVTGMTNDPDATLTELFERHVERYTDRRVRPTRDDTEVWRTYRDRLGETGVLERLTEHHVRGQHGEYTFKHAWKNEVWHCFEPVSLDYVEARLMKEKAERWLGRTLSLSRTRAGDGFKIYYLLGEPKADHVRGAFEDAVSLLSDTPVDHEIVRERAAKQFASKVWSKVAEHESHS